MIARGLALAAMLPLFAACTYYNSIYNAERVFHDAERERRAGRDSAAAVLYDDVVRKASEGYRRDPEGDWAYEALLLVGRARLRSGELRAARAAFETSLTLAADPDERLTAIAYLGVVAAQSGDADAAVRGLNEALAGSLPRGTTAEGHLARGRILLSSSNPEAGLWDLDRAAEIDPALRLEASLDRIAWGVRTGERGRTAESMRYVFAIRGGGARVDTVLALARAAGSRWDAGTAADLLAPVDSSRWDRLSRDRAGLERARFLHAAGDTAAATRVARGVGRGLGDVAAQAREQLARWLLAPARSLAEVYAARAILLPSADHPKVATMLAALDSLDELSLAGVDEPLAWFAAAEVARERLASPFLARVLFLAYADRVPAEPWAPKALLAALELATGEGDRALLRGRLEAYTESPYVLAARGKPAAGFEALEERLDERLKEIRIR